MEPLAVLATGMITAVGLDAPSSCAAIRCALDRFEETRFVDSGGEWIRGAEVLMEPPLRGRAKLVEMAASAIRECLSSLGEQRVEEVPLLLCVAEEDRPARLAHLDSSLLDDIAQQLGVRFHPASSVMANGRVGGVQAVQRASETVAGGRGSCLIAGVDSFLIAGALAAYEGKRRLLTSVHSNGFIPGEAGAAVLLGPIDEEADSRLACLGTGFAKEVATIESEEPLRADGLSAAFRAALSDADCTFADVDFRLTDCNGEQYGFKEAYLGIARTMKKVKPEFDIWHPADCIGEVGAAIVPVIFGVARAAMEKEYAPGKGVLCHCGNDDGQRAAMILHYDQKRVR